MFKKACVKMVRLVVLMSAYTPRAFAGGLDSATQGAMTFKIWLYSFLGVCALIYLAWKGAEAWMDKGHWSEFVTACGKVAVVGGTVVLAPWLWNLFVS
jgi:hypothetical protein